ALVLSGLTHADPRRRRCGVDPRARGCEARASEQVEQTTVIIHFELHVLALLHELSQELISFFFPEAQSARGVFGRNHTAVSCRKRPHRSQPNVALAIGAGPLQAPTTHEQQQPDGARDERDGRSEDPSRETPQNPLKKSAHEQSREEPSAQDEPAEEAGYRRA